MKLKNIIFMVACFICAMSTSAFADVDVEIKDAANAIYTVSGTVEDVTKKDKPVNVFVIKKADMGIETSLDSLLSEGTLVSTNLLHQGSVYPNADGSFSYDFGIPTPMGFVDAWFDVYVGGAGFSYVLSSDDNYYVSFETTKEKAKEIVDFAITCKNADGTYIDAKIAELAQKLEDYKYVININTPLFIEASKTGLAKRLADFSAAWGLDFISSAETSISTFQTKIKEQALLDCFEQSKSTVVYTAGEYVYNDIFVLEPLNNETDTIYELYNSVNCGKLSVKNEILGIRFKDGAEIAKAFKKLVIKNAISSGIDSTLGYGYINQILTDANVTAAGLTVPKYVALTATSNANLNIYNNRNTLTLENLESVIETASTPAPQTDTGNNSGYKESYTPSKGNSGGVGAPVAPQPVAPQDDKFADIASVSWAKEAIEVLAEKKVISGYEDGSFRPEASITRAETAKIIVTAFEIKDAETDKNFSDAKDTDWYTDYVIKLSANGYMNGYSDDVFGATDSITRQDFVVTLYRVLGEPQAETEAELTDTQQIADYAKAAVNYFASKGMVSGFEDGTFRPAQILTRAQAAKIIYELTK